MGEVILLLLIALTLLTIFCLYKMLDKRGLYFALVILNLLAFVLTFKISYVFKMNVNLGIISLIASFTVIYLFVIKYGYKEVKNLLKVSLYSNIAVALLLAIMNYFIPAITETVSINMQGTFEYNYKILIVYPIIVLLSQFVITKLYNLVSKIQNNIPLCISLTYIITSILYTIIAYLLCYIGIMDAKSSLFIGISTYILGLAITIIHIIFINYLANKKVIKWGILFLSLPKYWFAT